ncbi:MAG: beta-ketoacyl-ACP synthase III [Phycisphaerales bacterium]
MPQPQHSNCGVRLAGTGSGVPSNVLTNADLSEMMDTTHEWIVQRTGICERRVCNEDENAMTLSRDAIGNALDAAGMQPNDLDLLIVATCTTEMHVPSTACRVLNALGIVKAAAFDLNAACTGFVYALNIADSLIRSGRHRAVGVVGCDVLSRMVDYNERSVSILFGDSAGGAVLVRDDNPERGCIYQLLEADSSGWDVLYCPRRQEDVREWDRDNTIGLGNLRMQGREVYRFAVTKFQSVIEDALQKTNLTADDVTQFICHQSNARIIESAIEKLGLAPEKVHINIDRFGNCSAGSVPLCLDQVMRAGKIKDGDIILLAGFGAGLTWASSVWRV